MPKQQPVAELDAVQRLVEGAGEPVGVDAISRALRPPIPRRNLQRRLAHLVAAGRIVAEGRGRGTRYAPVTGIDAGARKALRLAEAAPVARLPLPRTELARLCRSHHVRRLDLFGSAAAGRDRPGSDLDFLVEFEPMEQGYSDNYFDLLESLERLFARPVDLVVANAIRNPYFRQSVEKTRTVLYAA